jgi:hypothetical protein
MGWSTVLTSVVVFYGVVMFVFLAAAIVVSLEGDEEKKQLSRESIVLRRCVCGRMPDLYSEKTEYYGRLSFAYFCECGKQGAISATIAGAARFWNVVYNCERGK